MNVGVCPKTAVNKIWTSSDKGNRRVVLCLFIFGHRFCVTTYHRRYDFALIRLHSSHFLDHQVSAFEIKVFVGSIDDLCSENGFNETPLHMISAWLSYSHVTYPSRREYLVERKVVQNLPETGNKLCRHHWLECGSQIWKLLGVPILDETTIYG